jgi:hypothetical protein
VHDVVDDISACFRFFVIMMRLVGCQSWRGLYRDAFNAGGLWHTVKKLALTVVRVVIGLHSFKIDVVPLAWYRRAGPVLFSSINVGTYPDVLICSETAGRVLCNLV